MNTVFIITYIIGLAVGLFITYLIIKTAVVNGIKEVIAKLEMKTDEQNGYTTFTIRGNVKQSNGNESDLKIEIERQVYLQYSKKKLPIDYSDTVDNQKLAVQKIIDERTRKRLLTGVNLKQ